MAEKMIERMVNNVPESLELFFYPLEDDCRLKESFILRREVGMKR